MTTTLVRPEARPAPAAEPPRHRHRADIEGLRAVAVLLVVLAHVGVPRLAGGFVGVDVFFVISGFLITSLLRAELLRTGRLDLPRFYARRAVRLLPLATLVIASTLAAAWWLAPPNRFGGYAADAVGAATYTMNLRLADAGTDYFADQAPSPFQHFWSLAVEEQFYLIWPVLIGALAIWGRRRRWLPGAVLSLGTIASFAWSVHELGRAAPWAYFGSLSRAWELGAGALLALLLTGTRTKRPWLGWLGAAAVVAAAVLYDEATPFPGTAALVPVLGTIAVIAAGGNRLLETWPMRWVGRMSYGWYLWHWPMLFLAPAGLPARAGFAAAALGLAAISHHLLENPVRHHRFWQPYPRRGLGFGFVLSAAAAGLAAFGMIFPPLVPTGEAVPDARRLMARAVDPAAELKHMIVAGQSATKVPENLTPEFETAAGERSAPQDEGCHVGLTGPFAPQTDCAYADTDADRTVVLFGDSHALQWFPAFEDLAKKHDWRLMVYTRSACSPADLELQERRAQRRYTECDTWRRQIIKKIGKLRADLVVVSSSVNYRALLTGEPSDPDAVWRAAWRRTLDRLQRAAGQVAILGDTPFLAGDPADCLATRPAAIGTCAPPADMVVLEPGWRAIQRATGNEVGIPTVDPLPWLCAQRCPLVVGNRLVYRDSNHMTSAYARLIAPLLDPKLPWHPRPDR
ncbi:putative acyltransferase [Actinoplanes missouriensis 431]|uniref:Putative acyltransferase n=1 Tax=Actinoplanes missouriensis (strain ATCC 14538 / DSM 43046 / CBS 188.64 / JCM 3121 / NBRC 102363 / NCIMB 12654 / NRRL B-3342 / UNCC 431) TaxID=512565 RepID=I0HGX9_ACTM4|nr:acyltransferase family protein [Actinoplanes missouriensis]BAL92266.1 putative acyltransferase [Actinoplanes missouriensis 431]